MYKPLSCKKCGQMIFDEADIANLVRSKAGVSRNVIDCPHCGCRLGLIVVSDSSGWLACLVPSEGVDVVYRAFQEAWDIGVQVNLMSAILDKLMAKHLEARK